MADAEVTFVNIIEVEPGKKEEVLKILQEGTESVMKKRPGFISVTLLASKDGRRVINVAKWRSAADVQAVQTDAAAGEFAKRIGQIAKPSPGLFDVVGHYTA